MVDFVKKPELESVTQEANADDLRAAETTQETQQTSAQKNEPEKNVSDKPDLSQKAFDQIEKKPWNSTPQGRLAIRTFSRGIMGAAFFTAGGLLTRKWMHSQQFQGMPSKTMAYDPTRSLKAQMFGETVGAEHYNASPLKVVASIIDKVAGNAIEKSVTALGGNGLEAVRFRPTRYNGYRDVDRFDGVRGRSLGDEAVNITFDFFAASVGDAFGRDLAGWFDPAVKKTWLDDKGHFVPTEAVKSMCKSVFQYITYNGGEDWAVAIPYAYYMKGQRHVLNRIRPGWQALADRPMHGAGFEVDDHGKVVGEFTGHSVADLQGRFTVYNMGTLLYREAYDYVDNKIHGRPAALFGAADQVKNEKGGVLSGVVDVAKWMVRGVIKGGIYMTPAVPFFWVTRSTQQQEKGLFVHPQHGVIGYHGASGKGEMMHADEVLSGKITANTPIHYINYDKVDPKTGRVEVVPITATTHNPAAQFAADMQKKINPKDMAFNPHYVGKGVFGKTMDAIGRWNEKRAKSLDGLANVINQSPSRWGLNSLGLTSSETATRFTHNFADAAISYTPYMYMKAETANLWDTGKMDLSAERLVNGLFNFNVKEISGGAHDIVNTILYKPLSDPQREAEAQRRIETDTSLSADKGDMSEQEKWKRRNREMAQYSPEKMPSEKDGWHTQLHKQKKPETGFAAKEKVVEKPHWSERLVQGEKSPEVQTVDKKASFTEREELRKALEEAQPPTNSLH